LVELKGGPKVSEAGAERAEPTDRVVPTERFETTGSTVRVEHFERVVPDEPVMPTDRAEATGPTGGVEPDESVVPDEPVMPTDRVKTTGPTGRVESTEPTDRVQSAIPTDSPPPSAGRAPETPGMERAQAAPERTEPSVSNEDIAAELQGRSGELGLAEAKFQLGEELLKERQYKAAHRLFEEAVQIYDQAAQFHAYLGWSKFQMQPEDPSAAEAALDTLQRAINLNPKVDKSYLFSGYIYKALGRMDQAETHFEKAIQCNPDCTEALHELKSLSHGGG